MTDKPTPQTKDTPMTLPAPPPPPRLGLSVYSWGPSIFVMVGGFY
jgi:hypothetical protein